MVWTAPSPDTALAKPLMLHLQAWLVAILSAEKASVSCSSSERLDMYAAVITIITEDALGSLLWLL